MENKVIKVVVYTAIMGKFDNLKDPLVVTPNVDYICFTDNPKLKSKLWKIILIDKVANTRLKARELKILGHCVLSDYHYSVWVDGNIKIKKDLSDLLIKYINEYDVDLSTFKHPVRSCIYDEALECVLAKTDSVNSISKQLKFLVNKKYPVNNGLVESNVVIRKINSEATKSFCQTWWKFVENVTIRDQLSFNYVMEEVDIKFRYLEGNSRGNSIYFEWCKHDNRSIFYKIFLKFSNFMLKRL